MAIRFDSQIDEIERQLRTTVDMLAGVIGERHVPKRAGALEGAARYIEKCFTASGYTPTAQEFIADGCMVRNIIAEKVGTRRPNHVWIIGAHYDSIEGAPGADDNTSGTVGVMEIARLLSSFSFRDTVRFVTFVNEEPPFYKGSEMGSVVYATRCRSLNENIRGMINLEMIGCFKDLPGGQEYPYLLTKRPWKWLLPRRGNFLAFVANKPSAILGWKCWRAFKRSTKLRSFWVPALGLTEAGMSDHWSFWEQNYPAIMVTDTAFFRYDHYHKSSDTPDKLNYPEMAKGVSGLAGMIARLAGAKGSLSL